MQQHSPERIVTTAMAGLQLSSDRRACARLIRSGSKSFFAASLLLPKEVRADALVLYAFCRLADDAVDQCPDADRVSRLRDRLALIYDGRPADTAVDRAFAALVLQHHIPRALPEALLEGFEWDLRGRRYETLDELIAYAVRVAGSVGTMMACLMQTRGAEALARACDLGVAMQLTNIARDVGEDARAGRLYLPGSWLREAGVDGGPWLHKPESSPALQRVIARLLGVAEELYARAAAGIALLPRRCRWSIHAALTLYAEIGRQLLRCDVNPVADRTVVSTNRKLFVLARAAFPHPAGRQAVPLAHSVLSLPQDRSPAGQGAPLPQGALLVEAVLRESVPPERRAAESGGSWDHAIARVVAIFAALEQRDRDRARAAVPGAATPLSGATGAS
jgi:15-cis-phytoene synthase